MLEYVLHETWILVDLIHSGYGSSKAMRDLLYYHVEEMNLTV